MEFWDKLADSLREDVDVDSLKKQFETWKNEQISGVIQNKEKILEEKKNLQSKMDEMQKQFQPFIENELTYDKFEELQVENEALKKASESPEDSKEKEKIFLEQGKNVKEKELRPEIERLQKEHESVNKDLEEYKERYQKYRVKNEVVSTLKKLNVEYDDFWLDGLMNRSKFEYNSVDDEMSIELFVPENGTTVPIADWVKIFPNTTQGKKMIKAPQNTGGGASRGASAGRLEPKEMYKGMFH